MRLRAVLIETEAEATVSARNVTGSKFADAGAASLRVAAVDLDGAWARAAGARAVLARPDGHVAWIGEVGEGTNGVVGALRRALGRR